MTKKSYMVLGAVRNKQRRAAVTKAGQPVLALRLVHEDPVPHKLQTAWRYFERARKRWEANPTPSMRSAADRELSNVYRIAFGAPDA